MDVNSTAARSARSGLIDSALEQFEGYGRYLNEGRGAGLSDIIQAASQPAGAANIGVDGLKEGDARGCGTTPAKPKFGIIGRSLGKLGAVLDAASGIDELAQTFAAERGRSDLASRLNTATLGKSIEVTARISATSIVGSAVCAAVAGATGLTVLPLAAGVGAGIAAGYAVGKMAEGARWAYAKLTS